MAPVSGSSTLHFPAGILVHHYLYVINQIWHEREDHQIHDLIDITEGKFITTRIAITGTLQIPLSTIGFAMIGALDAIFTFVTEMQLEWLIPVWNVVSSGRSIAGIATSQGPIPSNDSNALTTREIDTTPINPSGIVVLPPRFTGTSSTIKSVLFLLQRAIRICYVNNYDDPIRAKAPTGTHLVSDATSTGFRLSLTILKDGTGGDLIDWDDVSEAFIQLIQSLAITGRWETFVTEFTFPGGQFAEVNLWQSYPFGDNATKTEVS